MRRADVRARKHLAIGLLTLLLMVTRVAQADDANGSGEGAATAHAAAKLSGDGFALYKGRDFRHAAEKFLQAYTLDQDPNLLFNIARCYEALGDTEAAIEKYEAFVAIPDAEPQAKRRAAETIRALRQGKGATATASGYASATSSPSSSSPGRDTELATPTSRARATSSGDGHYAELSTEGLSLYKAREYRRAAEKFLQAYAFDPDPNLLFNVARCYGALGDSASAIEKYEAYLNAPEIDGSGRERAQTALRALRHEKPQATPASVTVAPTNLGVAGGSDSAASGNGRAVAGWVTTAILAAGTVATGVLALDSASKLKTARDAFPGDGPDISKRASRTTALTVSADALGIATVVMGGLSLYWTLTGPSSSSTELKASVGPGSLKISGSF